MQRNGDANGGSLTGTALYFDLASEKAFVNGEDSKNNDIGIKAGVRCYF